LLWINKAHDIENILLLYKPSITTRVSFGS